MFTLWSSSVTGFTLWSSSVTGFTLWSINCYRVPLSVTGLSFLWSSGCYKLHSPVKQRVYQSLMYQGSALRKWSPPPPRSRSRCPGVWWEGVCGWGGGGGGSDEGKVKRDARGHCQAVTTRSSPTSLFHQVHLPFASPSVRCFTPTTYLSPLPQFVVSPLPLTFRLSLSSLFHPYHLPFASPLVRCFTPTTYLSPLP